MSSLVQFQAFRPFQAMWDRRPLKFRSYSWDLWEPLGSAGTARTARRDATPLSAAVGTGSAQTNRRTDAAGAIGALDSVLAPLCKTAKPRVQPESGRLGERMILWFVASLAPAITPAFVTANRPDGSRTGFGARSR
jgi:hypothetical protein